MKHPGMRTILCASLLLAASCRIAQSVRPASVGDWRVNAQSNAMLATRDGGDFGDTDALRAGASAGKFIADGWMLEGVGTLEFASEEDTAGNDQDVQILTVGAGVRYYFDTVSPTRPYTGVQAGLAYLDFDDDASGIDDSDTAPFVRVGGGMEMFLNDHVAVDAGLALEHIMDLKLNTAEDDITTVAAFVGLSIWL